MANFNLKSCFVLILGALFLQVSFQNCSQGKMGFSELTKFEASSTTTEEANSEILNFEQTVDSNLEVVRAEYEVAKTGPLSEKIEIQIADSFSQDIVLSEAQIRASAQQNLPITQEIHFPKFKVKRLGEVSQSKLVVIIKARLMKQMVTSDSIAFPSVSGFNSFSIAYKSVPVEGITTFLQLPTAEDAYVDVPHDFRLDLRGFLLQSELAYGTGYLKIDYEFPEISFKKSIIVALSTYKSNSVSGGGLPQPLELLSGTEAIEKQGQTIQVCNTQALNYLKWQSQNSLDICQSQTNLSFSEQVSHGVEYRSYLPVGGSVKILGSNKLKFLSSGSTSGSLTLVCSAQGWQIQDVICRNDSIYDPAESPTAQVEALEKQARDYSAGAQITVADYRSRGDVSEQVIQGILAEVERLNRIAQSARLALPERIRIAKLAFDPNQGVNRIELFINALIHQ